MPGLFIGIASFISAGYNGDTMRWDLYEDASNVLNDSHSEAGPHGQVYEFTYSNNIRDIPYRIELYDVPPGAGVGNLVKSWVVTPTTSTIDLEDDIEIIVGHGDPFDPNDQDSATPVIPVLAGRVYNVYQRMVGQLLRVREAEFTPDTVNGGFSWNFGRTFSEDDVFIIRIKPVLIINPPGTIGSTGVYKDVELITSDRVVTNDDAGKLFLVQQSTKVLTITMPVRSTFPEKVPLYIQVIGDDPNAINVVVQAQTGETIMQNTFNDLQFIFSRGQSGQIMRLGSQWYGKNDSPDAQNRGQWAMCNWVSANRIVAKGQEVNSADYPGLKQALSKFVGGAVCTTSNQWSFPVTSNVYYRFNETGYPSGGVTSKTVYPNKGRFGLYMVSGVEKIRIPLWLNMFQRGLRFDWNEGTDGDRVGQNVPGGFQQSRFPEHDHALTHGRVGGIDGNPNGGGWGQPNKIGELIETTGYGVWKTGGGGVGYNTQNETAPDNIAQFPCVII